MSLPVLVAVADAIPSCSAVRLFKSIFQVAYNLNKLQKHKERCGLLCKKLTKT